MEDSSDEDIQKKKAKKNSLKNNKEKGINENMNKNLNIKEEIEGHYYKVSGLNKIKLMIYDFDQEMIVDKGMKKDNKSEIDNIIMNYKLKIPNAIDEDSNDPSLKIETILRKYSNKELKKEKTENKGNINGSPHILSINDQKKNNKEKEMYKKIENALSKNDREKVITRFFILILITSFILFGLSSHILYYITSNLDDIKNNLLLIIYSANIRHYTNMGIYYVREMTLLSMNISNKIYSQYPTTNKRTVYFNEIKENLKKTFFSGHNNIELLMGLNVKISKSNSFYLYNKPIKTLLLNKNKKRAITTSLTASIVQIYSFFYNLLNSENIEYNNQEVKNFLYNSLNGVALGIEKVVKVFQSEISIRRKRIINFIGIDCIIVFIFFIVIYIVIYKSFLGIIYKKESYISVFYGINLNFIKTSMIKCEKFIERIKPNELLIAQEKNNDNNDDSYSTFNLSNDLAFMNESNKTKEQNNKINNQNGKKNEHKEIQQVRIFQLKLILFLVLCYFYIFAVLWKFILSLNKMEIMGNFIYHQQHFHNNFLNIINAFREFIFSNDSYMYNLPIYEYLLKAEKELHITQTTDLSYIEKNCVSIDGLCELFSELQRKDLCISIDNNNINGCDNHLQIITSLGFYNFYPYWQEEIRFKRNYALIIIKLKQTNSFWKDNENKILDLYNLQEVHTEVNFLFKNIILTTIEEERNVTLHSIFENISSNKSIYIIRLIVYFFLILVLFTLYWGPFINNITLLIYKTKNILNIIPVEILSSQTNIKSLLNISDLNE